ncbi:unnamed protein product, partial [Nippostrongylus brasiliensis]|uniref:ANK_REP_REGION domain-containing protein n=1 Tax=Nippostrongylus brasiliensis TaxID=27835 RepID=A0A0N4XE49_NIPBR
MFGSIAHARLLLANWTIFPQETEFAPHGAPGNHLQPNHPQAVFGLITQSFRRLSRQSSLCGPASCWERFERPLMTAAPRMKLLSSGQNAIQSNVDCVAAHFCVAESAESTESATLLRSLAVQLTKRFPNLVLPRLSTLTLLADYDNALEQFFTLPLASLPRPARPMFILIDNIVPHIYELILASSWFFVDQLARAVDLGIVAADRVPCGAKDLMDDICLALPQRLNSWFILSLGLLSYSTRTLRGLLQIFVSFLMSQFSDPLIVAGSWAEIDGDLAPYHTAWAEFYKTKRRKTPQDVVELAYHLAHSTVPPMDSVRTLSSVGAGELILKCSVIDIPTSVLLTKAGALLLDTSPSVSSSHFFRSSLNLCWLTDFVESVCNGQWNALRSAACNNHLDVLDLLIGIAYLFIRLGSAGHREIVSRLLEANATVDRKDSEDRTALMAAAFMDHWEIVDLLLDHGASISVGFHSGATALHLALSNGSKSEAHDKTVRTLIRRGSDLSTADAHGRVCIHLAAYHGDKNLPSLFGATCVDVQDCLGRTPLMLAASQGQLEAVDQLVKNGAYIDCIDSDGRTAFQLAAIHGHLPVVDMLLALGADEAHKDNDGAVALHYAVAHDDVTLCRALATSVTVHATDRAGNHPLINACQSDNEEVVRELLGLGAHVEQLSLNGQSALRVAALSGNLLAEHNTDWEQHDMDGTPLVHTLLINKQLLFTLGAFISARDAHGRTWSFSCFRSPDSNQNKKLENIIIKLPHFQSDLVNW